LIKSAITLWLYGVKIGIMFQVLGLASSYSVIDRRTVVLLRLTVMKNYYSLLGIDTSATKAEVKKNYRLLATKFHPDKNSDPEAPAKFIEITEAYNVLSNRKARAQYDLARWQAQKQAKETAESFRTVVPPRVSLRTRRNKAQRVRGVEYLKTQSSGKRFLQLTIESLRITSRYTFYILGLALFVVILKASFGDVLNSFNTNVRAGITNVIIVLCVLYVLFLITKYAFLDFQKDTQSFSVFFKLSQRKATLICSFVMFLALVLVIGFVVMRT